MASNAGFGVRKVSGAEERVALEMGIAEAQNSINAAHGTAHEELRATLMAFIEKAQQRIVELGARAGR